jgi:hypothetical protein
MAPNEKYAEEKRFHLNIFEECLENERRRGSVQRHWDEKIKSNFSSFSSCCCCTHKTRPSVHGALPFPPNPPVFFFPRTDLTTSASRAKNPSASADVGLLFFFHVD